MQDAITTPYNQDFFDAQAFESLQSAHVILPELLRHVRPQSVIDVGCGVGSWLRAAGELAIPERLGVDGDYVNRSALMIPADLFMAADLSRPGLAEAVAARRPGRFDLVMCLEVAEHLAFERSAGLVHDLCLLGDVVLFSAAIPFQHGTGHINEQWPEYWAIQFRSHGYTCFDLLRPQVWDRRGVNWWYAQNILVFARQGSEAHKQLPPAAEAGIHALARVHPETWLSGALSVWHQQRNAARAEEQHDFRALSQAWATGEWLVPPLRALERARTAPPGARDVFPFTRLDTAEPEHLINAAEAAARDAKEAMAAALAERAMMGGEMSNLAARVAALEGERDAERLRADRLAAEAALASSTLSRHKADLAESEARVATVQADLAASEARFATVQAANCTLRTQTATYERLLAELSARAAMVESLQEEMKVLRDEAARSGEAETHLTGHTAALQHRLDLLHLSTSWRVTAPLRAARLLLPRSNTKTF